MSFKARVSLPDAAKPTRGYIYRNGLEDAFGSAEGAKNHLVGVIKAYEDILEPSDYVLAIIWGYNNQKIAELFGFGDIDEWPGNPEVYSWVLKNGIYCPGERNFACGNVIRLLGMEETYRRCMKDLDEYMHSPPNLQDLEPEMSL